MMLHRHFEAMKEEPKLREDAVVPEGAEIPEGADMLTEDAKKPEAEQPKRARKHKAE